MAKKQPGNFDTFNGLWVRGHVDDTPSDHFSDCLNTTYVKGGVASGDRTFAYSSKAYMRMALYKPTPPFTGTNVPRILALDVNGNLFDILLSTTVPIYTNALMKDFGFVNFFGRAYISPSDGKVGLSGVNVQVYSGSGVTRDAGGVAPTAALTFGANTAGNIDPGRYLVSYAFETASGFITKPAPFTLIDSFGTATFNLTGIATGPAGTVARWIIITKPVPLGIPFPPAQAEFVPTYFVTRIPNNTATTQAISFFEEELVDEADYLFTRLVTIPAGVGLLDYKGRMVSYGEFANPSIVRVSEIGEPESFSSTSGFFITDPSDSTGVRSATEFRGLLYVFKRHRGYVTQDNQLDASTWDVLNFEKSLGTEQYGIAAVLDAKGAQSNGFMIASMSALYYFNGTVVEPELSYKIRDLWLRINKSYFHKVQVALDPDSKRIYILVPLDGATIVSHVIIGNYRNGLDSLNIKWSITQWNNLPRSILIYEDFTNDDPSIVTRVARDNGIITVDVDNPGTDNGLNLPSFFDLAPIRFGPGISEFSSVRIRAVGPCEIDFTVYGEDKTESIDLTSLDILTNSPGREYTIPMNLVSEQCTLRIHCENGSEYKINHIIVGGRELWKERPR